MMATAGIDVVRTALAMGRYQAYQDMISLVEFLYQTELKPDLE